MTHPETGRQSLYSGRRRTAYVDSLPLAESEALIDELWRVATARVWRHARQRRLLHRTQIKGETRPATAGSLS